jgi:hypothetical protein
VLVIQKREILFDVSNDQRLPLEKIQKNKDYCALLYDRLKGVFQQNYADLCPKNY